VRAGARGRGPGPGQLPPLRASARTAGAPHAPLRRPAAEPFLPPPQPRTPLTARCAHHPPRSYATGPWRQFSTLLWRELLAITRNPFDVAGRTLTFAWVGLFMGVLNYGIAVGGGAAARGGGKRGLLYSMPGLPQRLYSRPLPSCLRPSPRPRRPPAHPKNTPAQADAASVANRLKLLHMVLCFYLLMPYVSMGLYAADKKFVVADASSQLYRPLAYYLAKVSWVGWGEAEGMC
jgi:hypothetical protein